MSTERSPAGLRRYGNARQFPDLNSLSRRLDDGERCHTALDNRVFVVFLDDALEAENMTRLHPVARGPLVSALALSRCELKPRVAAAVGAFAHQGEAIPS